MNQTDPTDDFDGCRRACRQAGAHTLAWGECEHAPEPEPTVSLSRVYADVDGRKSIGFDSYTVPQLAELITAGLRASDLAVDADAFVDIASVAAYAIVHRNDEQPAAPAVFPEPPSRAATLRELEQRQRPNTPPSRPEPRLPHHTVNEEEAPAPVKQRADCTEIEWVKQERARFERLYTRETVRADLAEQRADTAARDADIYQQRLERLSDGYTEQRKRAEALERAMESTAADALKHRGCHRDLMAQCLRAERAEAEAERLRADRAAVLNAATQHLYTALFPAVYDDMGQKAAEGVNRAVSELRRLAAEAQQQETDGARQQPDTKTRPARGDAFEAWLKAQRDQCFGHASSWGAVDGLLDQYRLHADTGTPLSEHVCEGQAVGDCECLEPAPVAQQPAAEARPWLVQKICCGHDDGTAEFATWEAADNFREVYIDSARIADHERSAIIRRSDAAAPVEPAAVESEETRHTCGNCEGVDPDTCLTNPDRPASPPV